MPDLRTNKSISERFDVEFNLRPASPLRRWRRLAAWACIVLPLLAILIYEVVGDGSAYTSGPLFETHQSEFEQATGKGQDGCAMCHTHTAQPLWRLVSGSRFACSVDDNKCVTCHPRNPRLGHSPHLFEHDVLNCATCHEEHRGKNLKDVANARCVSCHGNLRTKEDTHNFLTHIPSFAGHPEFAASRFREASGNAAIEEVGKEHGVLARARFSEGKLVDRTPLYFNHAAHLSRHGTLLLDDTPTPDDERLNIIVENKLRWKRLECVDCHQQTSDGKYMEPIQYQKHCATCHPLSYSSKLPGPNPLKHVDLENVFIEANARLLKYAQDELRASKEPRSEDDDPRLPSKHRHDAALAGNPDLYSQALWPDLREVIKGGCAHCHMFKAVGEAGTDKAVAVEPPQIPNRWLPHSQFNHKLHVKYSCITCHNPAAAVDDGDFPWEAKSSPIDERVLEESRSTADILMPSVAVCQKCHVSNSRADWARANADCIECHTYHHKSPGTPGK